MYQVAVQVAEENQPVALIGERIAGETHAALFEFLVSGVEIIHFDSQVANPGRLHLVGRFVAFARNNLEHGAVGGAYEIVARIGEVDAEIEVIAIPTGQRFRIWRGDGGVFEAFEHNWDCIRPGARLKRRRPRYNRSSTLLETPALSRLITCARRRAL